MADTTDPLDVLFAIAGVLLGLWSLFVGLTTTLLSEFASTLGLVAGVVALGAGIGLFVAIYGVFTGQPWTGTAAVGAFGADFARRVVTLATDDVSFFVVSALFTLVSGAGAAYFFLHREKFTERGGEAAGSAST